jgi:hypothetical protein
LFRRLKLTLNCSAERKGRGGITASSRTYVFYLFIVGFMKLLVALCSIDIETEWNKLKLLNSGNFNGNMLKLIST